MKDKIIRISISLLDIDPAIWRRIEAPASMTLEGLHDVIQVVMGPVLARFPADDRLLSGANSRR